MAARTVHEPFMRRALAVASEGVGRVEPNPRVGAVVVRGGRIVGEGAHLKYGGPHAEVVALRQAGRQARGATLYTNLEPCSTRGKTPPCTEQVIEAGIRRVVYATADPTQNGARALRRAGIRLVRGVCLKSARVLNAPFFKPIETGLPYVMAKWAMSLDGRLATRTGDAKWISSAESRRRSHADRARFQAILVGAGTVRKDNPRLRGVTAAVLGGRIPKRAHVVRAGSVIFSTRRVVLDAEVLVRKRWTVKAALRELVKRGVQSVMIEGGRSVLDQAFAGGVVDEVLVIVAPQAIGRAARLSGSIPMRRVMVSLVANDIWIRGAV